MTKGGMTQEPIQIFLLALPSASPINIFGTAEVFEEANAHLSRPVYNVRILSTGSGGERCLENQWSVDEISLADFTPEADTVLLAGGLPNSGPPLMQHRELIKWARVHCPRARRFGGICSGSLLLAEAGLLHKRQATTHWSCIDFMAHRYPTVEVLPNHIYVKDGECYTAAGGSSAIDMALSLVEEDLGTEIAVNVAKRLVLFLRRTGAQPQLSTTLLAQSSSVPTINNLLVWMADNLHQDLSVKTLARRIAMSPRNFTRHFLREVGNTPGRHVSDLRLEAARRNLAHGNLSLGDVAKLSGFGSVEVFRRLFTKALGLPPGKYRQQQRGTGANLDVQERYPLSTGSANHRIRRHGRTSRYDGAVVADLGRAGVSR